MLRKLAGRIPRDLMWLAGETAVSQSNINLHPTGVTMTTSILQIES